jgi:hypothetical protein
LIVVCLLGACGNPENAATETSTSTFPPMPTEALNSTDTTMLPATSLVGASPPVSVDTDGIAPVQVVEPCPVPEPGTPGTGDVQTEVGRLEPMLGQVLAYGGQHPDEFGNYGLVWHGDGDASVVISFTSNLDAHRSALRSEVAYPDELIVCQVAISGAHAQALSAKLVNDLAGRFQSIGQGIGPIEVVLNAGEDALADQLADDYGDAVRVTVCADATACALGGDESGP